MFRTTTNYGCGGGFVVGAFAAGGLHMEITTQATITIPITRKIPPPSTISISSTLMGARFAV